MSKRMLVDGAHPEEIRVVVTSGNRLDEYDIETTFKKQVKGNIYLAKVTRVEPSLQAAFVDFGGNRHGFLAFSEIHPDYYQIPMEDRQALIDEQKELERQARAAREHLEDIDGDIGEEGDDVDAPEDDEETDDVEASAEEFEDSPDDSDESSDDSDDDNNEETAEAAGSDDDLAEADLSSADDADDAENADAESMDSGDDPVPVSADPDVEEALEAAESSSPRRTRGMRRYKIQEVIKRRQILLVQVVKEERGNKGAALTTYISLAGRYCVLMPNSSRGGGISRKITGSKERRKLRDTLKSLDMPDGMGVIIRTAGLERNKAEIKRDFEYLIRAWDEVRETTLESTAPSMVYEEGDIIKRAIRDVYSKDIEEIQVEGAETYQTAKRFMRLMMPSHAKRVQQYRDDTIPLYQRFQIEQQLDAMHNPEVQLKSGGYIVINPTEALVAIDVNSGKSTRERNIEETAVKTNIEAAEEVARQLRLRDLAGLIVIDFIDMEDGRNVRKVERRLKEAMKTDRARLQIGRISNFGLLELSRQRLRPSLLETSSQICPHCRGTGNILSTESMAMRVLRAIEEEGIRMRTSEITVRVPTEVALYILNQKRATLVNLESRYGFQVILEGDDTVVPPDIDIERVKGRPEPVSGQPSRGTGAAQIADHDDDAEDTANEEEEDAVAASDDDEEKSDKPKRSRRRRGRRRSQSGEARADTETADDVAPDSDASDDQDRQEASGDSDESGEEKQGSRRRRRGRRGGRRRNRNANAETQDENAANEAGEAGANDDGSSEEPATDGNTSASEAEAEADVKDNDTPDDVEADAAETVDVAAPEAEAPEAEASESNGAEPDEKPENGAAQHDPVRGTASETDVEENTASESDIAAAAAAEDNRPKRRGWWQKIVD
ncbi:MAG: Rne/Rng family ribonuclease [Alphaproteobacteria bacterium]